MRSIRHAAVTCALLAAVLLAPGCGAPGPTDAGLPPVAMFTRDWMAPVYEEDVPSLEERSATVRLALTPGEYEPALVAVRVKEASRGARLVVRLAGGPGGGALPAESFRVFVVRMIEPFERWPKLREHPRHPGYLDPLDGSAGVDLAAGVTRAFWITLRAPDEAAAGTYRGEVALVAGERELGALPLEVTVHPFRLEEAGPAFFVSGDNWPLSDAAFEESRAHGMNTICVNPGWPKQTIPMLEGTGFRFENGFAPTLEVVAAARRHGLGVAHPVGVMLYQYMIRSAPAGLKMSGAPVPEGAAGGLDFRTGFRFLYESGPPVEGVERWKGPYYPSVAPAEPPDTPFGRFVFEAWVAGMKELDRLARERDWQPFFYWVVDEPHQTRGSMRLAMAMVRAAGEAGADAMVTCNEPSVSEPDESKWWFPPIDGEPALLLEPHLKWRCYYNRYLGPATAERTRAAGDRYGTYINIYGNRPEAVRLQAGYLAFRLKLDHAMFWAWEPASTACGEGRCFLRDWEAAREGIDDLKYLEALERALASGQGAPAAREQAKALLERVRAEIPESLAEVGRVDGETGRWVEGKGGWPLSRYDALRGEVARAISALRASP